MNILEDLRERNPQKFFAGFSTGIHRGNLEKHFGGISEGIPGAYFGRIAGGTPKVHRVSNKFEYTLKIC